VGLVSVADQRGGFCWFGAALHLESGALQPAHSAERSRAHTHALDETPCKVAFGQAGPIGGLSHTDSFTEQRGSGADLQISRRRVRGEASVECFFHDG
jgi:hypothetical protein